MSGIVVGVDGSPSSLAALRFGLDEARLRGERLRVIGAWHVPVAVYGGALVPPAPELVRALEPEMRSTLERALADVGDAAAGVEVDLDVAEGAPARVLLDAAEDATLLVLGTRGLGGFRGLLLGSVSQQCAHHAPCPVVIVGRPRELDAG